MDNLKFDNHMKYAELFILKTFYLVLEIKIFKSESQPKLLKVKL